MMLEHLEVFPHFVIIIIIIIIIKFKNYCPQSRMSKISTWHHHSLNFKIRGRVIVRFGVGC